MTGVLRYAVGSSGLSSAGHRSPEAWRLLGVRAGINSSQLGLHIWLLRGTDWGFEVAQPQRVTEHEDAAQPHRCASQDRIELDVTGMTCGHCKAAVEGALKKVAGVAAVEVDLATGKARVSGEGVQLESLVAAVADEGYSASAAA